MSKSMQFVGDLPDDILLNVFEFMNIKSLQNVRFCCKHFRHLSESCMIRVFRKSVEHHKRLDINSEASVTFMVIDILVKVYRENGFSKNVITFLGQLMSNSATMPHTIKFADIRYHLLNFYKSLNITLAMKETQKDQMMFLITLIIILKNFKSTAIKKIANHDLLMQRTFEVAMPGHWFGVLWVTNKSIHSYIKNRNHVLILLAELLISDITSQELMHVMQFNDICYVYGYSKKDTLRICGMELTISMNGSKQACDLLESCIMSDRFQFENFTWPTTWSADVEFAVDIKINSKEVSKWGCLSEQMLKFHPFAEMCHNDNNDDDMNDDESSEEMYSDLTTYNTSFIGFRETPINDEYFNEDSAIYSINLN